MAERPTPGEYAAMKPMAEAIGERADVARDAIEIVDAAMKPMAEAIGEASQPVPLPHRRQAAMKPMAEAIGEWPGHTVRGGPRVVGRNEADGRSHRRGRRRHFLPH